MIITDTQREQERMDFAKKAARHFALAPSCWTYTEGEIATGAWLAMRWGLSNDCVLVLRIGDEVPVVYGQAIRDADGEQQTAGERA